jgi:hypothetical protein
MKSKQAYQQWYDTSKGIEFGLSSLSNLHALISARHAAGYDRGERLHEFIVLGRYWLDTCGNFMTATEGIPKDRMPDIPDIVDSNEFWQYSAVRASKSHYERGTTFSSGQNLAEVGVKCSHCGRLWDISDCHDVFVAHSNKVISLAGFVGKTLREVKAYFSQRDDAVYFMQNDVLIRNDKNIDLLPKYPNATEDWEKGMVKNERGWISDRDGVTDDYVIQDGDEGFFNVRRYYHKTCNRANLAATYEQEFRELLGKAGFDIVAMQSMPNEYCPCEVCAPWFNVETPYGCIKIGWRKRVINIDWSGITEAGFASDNEILALFVGEDITKGTNYIHAWGWEKAQDYLRRIYTLVTNVSVPGFNRLELRLENPPGKHWMIRFKPDSGVQSYIYNEAIEKVSAEHGYNPFHQVGSDWAAGPQAWEFWHPNEEQAIRNLLPEIQLKAEEISEQTAALLA